MLLVFGFRHRERVDVVAAPREQPDHARQHAGLVVDQNRKGVALDLFLDRRGRVMRRACRRWVAHHTSTLPRSSIALAMSPTTSPSNISLCALPDGIIGKQFSA